MPDIDKALADGIAALGVSGINTVFPGFGPNVKPQAYTQVIPSGGVIMPYATRRPQILTFQVNVIRPDSSAGDALAVARGIIDLAHRKINWRLDGWTVDLCEAMQPPILLGEENGMVKATFNLIIKVRKDR